MASDKTTLRDDVEAQAVQPAPTCAPSQQSSFRSWLLLHLRVVATFAAILFVIREYTCVSSKGSICAITYRPATVAMETFALPTHYALPSGDKIPSVALGVWQANPGEVGLAVKTALQSGYRHIDGAWRYGNEEEVGQAIRESGVPREEIWLTSKLWNLFHAPEDVEPALDISLNALGVNYLDLYIIHWPVAFKKSTYDENGTYEFDEALTADPYPTWKALEDLVDKGKVRNIGISNFNIPRIKNLTANPLKYQPAVNQVELNYWNPQPELLEYAKEHGMLLEAYSPLGSNTQVKETLELPVVQEIATNLDITPAQVLISWQVQRGVVTLPKSVTPSRVKENLQITALPEDLLSKLEKAATSHPPQRVINPSKSYGLPFDIFDDYPYGTIQGEHHCH